MENGRYDVSHSGYRDLGFTCNPNYLELSTTYLLDTK